MFYDWFTAERLAQEQHQLRLAEAERWRRRQALLREAQLKRSLERALARALRAGLPREELQAALSRALKATG